MGKFQTAAGAWTRFRRELKGKIEELDFHFDHRDEPHAPYWERMRDVHDRTLENLRRVYEAGEAEWLLITHGHSTSRPGKTTSRSQVRKLMRSSEATPYIVRAKCIQHESVFVAAIRPRANQSAGVVEPELETPSGSFPSV